MSMIRSTAVRVFLLAAAVGASVQLLAQRLAGGDP
jgi:hypothetical protein